VEWFSLEYLQYLIAHYGYWAVGLIVLPAGHVHHTWTTNEEVLVQLNFVGPVNIAFVNPADDPRKKRATKQ